MMAREAAISQGAASPPAIRMGMISGATGGRKVDTLARVESTPLILAVLMGFWTLYAAAAFGYAQWGQAIVFTVLIVVLVFRPAGLLGQQLGERA